MRAKKQQAATSRVTYREQARSWFVHHSGCLYESLLRFSRTPTSSILTTMVLAIALALPGGSYILSQNLLDLSKHWDTDTQMTLYLSQDIDDRSAALFSEQIAKDPRFRRVKFLSRAHALDEFRQMTGFQDALEHIVDNPLPAVIVITLFPNLSTQALADARIELLGKPQVELVQLDLEWVKRLRGIIAIIQRTVIIIAVILAIAVILVVGNTIRLEIESRRDEIVITKLFGATHAYIRRPFLYDGLWFGLIGGILACLLIMMALWLLSGPVVRLISLYDSGFSLTYPGIGFIIGIMLCGGGLGYLGAWSAVSQHLHKIEPE